MGARVLAAADVLTALGEPRPHRAALPAGEAAEALTREAHAGRLDAEAVRAVLAVAGHRPPRRRSGPAGLSARELEVLVLLTRGLSNAGIARELVISPKTVSRHLEHVYAKLGVSTRAAATLVAIQHGIVGGPP